MDTLLGSDNGIARLVEFIEVSDAFVKEPFIYVKHPNCWSQILNNHTSPPWFLMTFREPSQSSSDDERLPESM